MPPPPGGAAEASRGAMLRMVVSGMFVLGLLLLAFSAVAHNWGSRTITNATSEQLADLANWRNAYSPMLWNLGIFLVLMAAFGATAMFENWDPLSRILLLIVALVAALLILTGGVTLFK